MNRGSGVDPIQTTNRANRFNEAPIHESGKCEVFESVFLANEKLQ